MNYKTIRWSRLTKLNDLNFNRLINFNNSEVFHLVQELVLSWVDLSQNRGDVVGQVAFGHF